MTPEDRGAGRVAVALFTATAGAYAASTVLGTGVASGTFSTGRAQWMHHALYVATVSLGAAAASSLLWSRNRAGWLLLPAAVPLSVIPFAGTRGMRHPLIALSAAPFIAASALLARR